MAKMQKFPCYRWPYEDSNGDKLRVTCGTKDVEISDCLHTVSIEYEHLPEVIDALRDIWAAHEETHQAADSMPESESEVADDG